MLINLQIENFALIHHSELDFSSGLSVITGETGAGKSIVLDALSLALGARAENNIIHKNSDKCEIQAVFDITNYKFIQDWLVEKDLSSNNKDNIQECFLKRVITQDGRSKSFINYHLVPLQLLRELGDLLVTLHGQHEHQALLKRKTQRNWLDIYGHHEELLHQIKIIYQQIKDQEKILNQYKNNIHQSNAINTYQSQLEFLKFQIRELSEFSLDQINLKNLIPEHISETENTFKNYAQTKNNLNQYQDILNLLDDIILPGVYKIKNIINKNNIKNKFDDYLDTAEIELNQLLSEIKTNMNHIDLHPEKILILEKELDQLYNLSRKHHVRPNELGQLYLKLQDELSSQENLSQKISDLEKFISNLKDNYFKLAHQLTDLRKKSAKKMSQEIEKICHELSMEKAKFQIEISEQQEILQAITPNGVDKIDFKISINPGQDLQLLSKIASGGELSRISLAIDLIAARDQSLPVLIFDEIDVGISGATAMKVSKLLKKLSQKAQIICITHLAQVASQAEHHFQVVKNINKNKTDIQISLLNSQEKIQAVARLIGGEKLTQKALQHAKDLIES